MSKLQPMRALVKERLTAAAEEIFALFERTIAEYEEELFRTLKENQRKQRLLDEANPRVLLPRARAQVQSPSPSSAGPGLIHKVTKTLQIKEEPEEQRVKQEEEQLPGSVRESGAVCVKTEESTLHQQIKTEHSEETQEDDISSEPHSLSETEGNTEHSSDTDSDDDWVPSDAQMETEADRAQVHIRDRSTVAQNPGQSLKHKAALETRTKRNNGGTSGTSGANLKKHQCFVCKKTFLGKRDLQRHFRGHAGEKIYSCPVCPKKFALKGNLRSHEMIHTGDKPYSCSICKRTFIRKNSLNAHMRTHTGDKPFSCSHCSKTFTDRSNLKTHMKSHSSEKPYSCSLCNKKYRYSSSFRKHMRTQHNDKPEVK